MMVLCEHPILLSQQRWPTKNKIVAHESVVHQHSKNHYHASFGCSFRINKIILVYGGIIIVIHISEALPPGLHRLPHPYAAKAAQSHTRHRASFGAWSYQEDVATNITKYNDYADYA